MTQVAIPADQRFQGASIDTVYRFRAPKGQTAREAVEVNLPVPSTQEIISLLSNKPEDSKLLNVYNMVVEAIHQLVVNAGKVKVDADAEFNQDSVANIVDELSLYHIANLPRAERNMITNSDMEAFSNQYKEKAAAILGISQKAADALAGILSSHANFRRALTQEGMAVAIQTRITDFVSGLDDEALVECNATFEWLNQRIEDIKSVNIDPDEI